MFPPIQFIVLFAKKKLYSRIVVRTTGSYKCQ